MSIYDRRTVLKGLLAIFAANISLRAVAEDRPYGVPPPAGSEGTSVRDTPVANEIANFKIIYTNPGLREQFYLFLQNIFHLYPEDRFHTLISDLTTQYDSDQSIYEHLQQRLPEITPPLSMVTYALPALVKQKREMARETAELLGARRPITGYIEIGTLGRYVNALRRRFSIAGPIYVVNDRALSLSLEDIAERGQLRQVGQFVPLGNYDALDAARIPDASVELVTNLIGFHHAPTDRLDSFVTSIWRALKPGGKLVVRDHDVDRPDMQAMVALAHDVFNAGLSISWEENHTQVRNFTSVQQLAHYLSQRGFDRTGGAQLQDKDPTKNTLMLFTKRV